MDFQILEEKKLTTVESWYPQQNMELQCTRPSSFDGPMSWTMNDKPTTDTNKYTISNNNSTLTVKDISQSDRGESHIFVPLITLYILTVPG